MDCSVVRRDSLTGTYWTDVTDELCEEPFVASVPFVSSIGCKHLYLTINSRLRLAPPSGNNSQTQCVMCHNSSIQSRRALAPEPSIKNSIDVE